MSGPASRDYIINPRLPHSLSGCSWLSLTGGGGGGGGGVAHFPFENTDYNKF